MILRFPWRKPGRIVAAAAAALLAYGTAPTAPAWAAYQGAPPQLVSSGGTGATSFTTHGVVIGEGTAGLASTSAGTVGLPLTSGGSSADPAYNTLGVAGGGTGANSIPAHDIIIGNGTGAVNVQQGPAGMVFMGAGSSTDPGFSATPTLGVAGTTQGSLGIAGVTSGAVTLAVQAAAGTYNFNLPVTAGTSGQLLASAGGGGSPMTWSSAGSGLAWTATVTVASGAITMPSTNNFIEIVDKTTGAASAVAGVASPATNLVQCIKDGKGDAATNNITFTPNSGNVDGASTFVINQNYGSACLIYNGTQYNVW